MLTKIQASVVLALSFAYGMFEVWQVIGAPPKDLVDAVIATIFALLGVIFGGTQLKQAVKYDITSATISQYKSAA